MLFLLLSMSCSNEVPCPDGMIGFSTTTFSYGVQNPSRDWHKQAENVDVKPFCMDVYEYPNQKGEFPKGAVSWDEAVRLCTEQGKRLCSSAEWSLSCRGTEGRLYSYGNQYDRKKCNTPIDGSGPQGNKPPIAKSGSYTECHSAEGVFDLNGSLSE